MIYRLSFTMMRILLIITMLLPGLLPACNDEAPRETVQAVLKDADTVKEIARPDSIQPVISTMIPVDTQKVKPADIVDFAKTLVGVPYKYASTDPAQGFDCSGFITYVFRHFNIGVPRSSIDFTHVGNEIAQPEAKPGDLILFRGTDSASTVVGHMGIVTENTDSLRFIHSTSGRQYGVTITALGTYYQKRYVKVIRIF